MPVPRLDVSNLPSSAIDAESPLWWGNVIALAVETVILTLLVTTYFYLRKNFDLWPPPYVDSPFPVLHPVPRLLAASADTLLMVLSCVPVALMDLEARRYARVTPQSHPPEEKDQWEKKSDSVKERIQGKLVRGLVMAAAAMAVAIVLRQFEFHALYFDWNDNAYSSVVWGLLVLHLIYQIFCLVEISLLALWIGTNGLREKLAEDLTLVAGAWYWTVGAWLVIYAVVFWSPRWT